MEGIVQALVQFFGTTIPAKLTVFILSLMPVVELRGGILAAKLLHVDMFPAFFICLAGTLLPVPLILLFVNKLFDLLRNTRFVRLVDRLEAKGRSKFDKINRYETLGLMLFVAVPLPGTGAWTGPGGCANENGFQICLTVGGGGLVHRGCHHVPAVLRPVGPGDVTWSAGM